MYCNSHMLCLGDYPKPFKSLTYNHLDVLPTHNSICGQMLKYEVCISNIH